MRKETAGNWMYVLLTMAVIMDCIFEPRLFIESPIDLAVSLALMTGLAILLERSRVKTAILSAQETGEPGPRITGEKWAMVAVSALVPASIGYVLFHVSNVGLANVMEDATVLPAMSITVHLTAVALGLRLLALSLASYTLIGKSAE